MTVCSASMILQRRSMIVPNAPISSRTCCETARMITSISVSASLKKKVPRSRENRQGLKELRAVGRFDKEILRLKPCVKEAGKIDCQIQSFMTWRRLPNRLGQFVCIRVEGQVPRWKNIKPVACDGPWCYSHTLSRPRKFGSGGVSKTK